MEIWKDIKGYEGMYQVSNYGNVRGLDRYRISKNNTKVFVKGQMLKQHKSNRGYYRVFLVKDSKNKPISVHRLVAIHFIDNPENKPFIDHIDCDKSNNHTSNLRWVTASENMMNEKTYADNLKEHDKAKMAVICTDLEGNFVKHYESIIAVRKDGHNAGVVSKVCRGILNKHHNLLWKYAS